MTMDFYEVAKAVFDRAVKPVLANDELIRGENISPFPSVKIAFESYAEDDDGDEDYRSLSFVMYVHKRSNQKGFKFPEHKEAGWGLILSRDCEQACKIDPVAG